MIAKLKQEAMKQGMKLMGNPRFMKMMSDPRVMKAIGQAFALRGRVQSEIDERIRSVAAALNLATRDDVKELKRSLGRLENTLATVENKLEP